MKRLFEVISSQEVNRWQQALDSIQGLDVHYMLQYFQLFTDSGSPELFFYRKNDSVVIYPYIKRPINQMPNLKDKLWDELYDITTPYGFGGPIVSPGVNEKFKKNFYKCFSQYCREQKIITEFIRFHPILQNHRLWEKQVNISRVSANVFVDLTCSVEELWAGYEHSNQKNIKKASREGLMVLIEEDPLHFSDFLTVYHHTMERNRADAFYYFPQKFYEELHRNLKGNFVYAHTVKDEKIISTELLLFNDRYIHSYLGGTLANYFRYRPNNILKHEVIKWARARGIKYFILGGGSSDGDGIFRYKRSFSRDGVTDFYVGKNVYDKQAVQRLELLTVSDEKMLGKSFFPPYRR